VSATEIDDYLADLDEPGRSTLVALRASILAVVPDAEPGLAYGAPAFRMRGKVVAGFSAARRHLSYLPHSGAVLTTLDADLAGYERSKGALRFAPDAPLPDHLVRALVEARLAELGFH
jgi:uncharacterized protein YdhG (YjbR/CyaY superfamily)